MKKESLLERLERVERYLNIYTNETQDLVEEINIDIPLENLKKTVIPLEGDPLLYAEYVLTRRQVEELNEELGAIIKIDFDLYYYVLECVGIYKDWGNVSQ